MSEPIKPAAELPPQFRDIKATLPLEVFHCLQWASKRTFRDLPNGGRGCMPLADFFRLALLNQLRAVVREQIERGKAVPPDIAAVISDRGAGR